MMIASPLVHLCGGPLVSFEITLFNLNMSLKLNMKFNLNLNLNLNLSLKLNLKLNFTSKLQLKLFFNCLKPIRIQQINSNLIC